MTVMPAANYQALCYFALIDSRTLHTEGLINLMSEFVSTASDSFSIHALINRFSTVNRRRFILALNSRSSFTCTLTYGNVDYYVELYSTDSFGAAWSHILILRRYRDIQSYIQHTTATSQPSVSIIKTLSSIHNYNRLAANSLTDETPAAAKIYLDHAVTLFERLIRQIYGQLL